jgi:AcrR family transcriptional regulator
MVKPVGQHLKTAPTDVETRDRILAAAHRVFVRKGTAKARTQEVADEAGVNKALLHYYFGTKEALAQEVFVDAQRQLFPRIFEILGDPARSVERKVRDLIDFEIGFLSERPYLPGYVAAELHTNPERIAERFANAGPLPLALFQGQLDAAHADGRMRAMDAPQFVVTLLASIVFPFVMRPVLEKLILPRHASFKAFLADRRLTLADFFLAGLRP